MPEYQEYIDEIKSIWETRHITNFGPKYNKFLELLKERYGYEYMDLQCNGHMMLQNILATIEPGEIITTPFTFISTTLAIKNSGHTPIFCDINEVDYNIDVDKIEELITDKTVAIVPVHVYGSPCDVERIEEIAKKHNLKVVYDAAHAFDVKVNGKHIAEYGDASMFSLHGTKVFNSVEGGLGVVSTKEMLDEVVSRSNFGISDAITVYDGVNSKMNEFQASMGIVNLAYLDENVAKRKVITETYNQLLADIDNLKVLPRFENVEYNYAYYPVVVEGEGYSADGLMEFLEKEDVYSRRYFYPIASEMDLFKNEKGETPIAKAVADKVLCLPIYGDLEIEQVERICELVKRYFK